MTHENKESREWICRLTSRIGLSVLSLLLLAPSVYGQQFLLAPQYAAGGGFTYAVATADFNRDGKADLALGDVRNNTVDVLLGNGDGTFRPYVTYSTGWNPYSVVVGDFNGDGVPDLAVTSAGVTTNMVSILLGNGDGTFQSHIDSAIGGLPASVVPGDFNGDGKLDLAITDYSVATGQPSLELMLGNGDGTFQAPIALPAADVTGSNSGCLIAADFNGDGKLDLAGTNQLATSAEVLLGNGDGTFQTHHSYNTGFSGCTQAGDFNGDGKIDLVVAGGNTVRVLLGNGDGTFQPHVDTMIPEALISGGEVTINGIAAGVVGDFNGDGKLDLAWIDSNLYAIDVLFGNGDGTFQMPVSYGTASFSTNAVAIADVNGDGKPDLVVANKESAGLLLNRGNGAFQSEQLFVAGNTPIGEAVGDFNGDGKQDLVVANSGGNTASVFIGNGDGTVQPRMDYTTGNNPTAVLVVDVNGDGKPDLVVANAGSNSVSILLGNGDGTFGPRADFATGAFPQWIVAADFNGDGKLDLAVANNASNTVSLLLGNGDGSFQPHVDYATGFNTFSVTAADFNGDGKPDLAVAFPGDPYNQTTTPGGINVLINKGNGTFSPAVNYTSGGIPLGIIAGDLNHDGKPDLIATNGGQTCNASFCLRNASIGVLRGNGDGTFQAPVSYAAASGPNGLALGDFNGDGEADLITANTASNSVSVYWGNGDGTFRPRLDYVVGKSPYGVGVGDFNSDQKQDLAVSMAGGNNVAILSNILSNPSFVLSTNRSPTTGTSVFSDPAGIVSNEGIQAASYSAGTAVTLLETPTSPGGAVFTGWSGDCTGLAACVVDLSTDRSVTANYTANTTAYTLTINKSGNGTGTVADAPNVGQIGCGAFCSASFPAGTSELLGAAPDPGSAFAGWSATGCAHALDCTVTLSADTTVTATFVLNPVIVLSVAKAGNGSGAVISSPSGINCGSTCSASFPSGSSVQLRANPNASSTFSGWSGACSGTSTCTVTVSAAASVTATFNLQDFSMTPASPSMTLPPGGEGTDVITLAGMNGPFANAIQLSCSVAGTGPTCAFSPQSVTPGSGSATSTLTVKAPSLAGQLRVGRPQHGRMALALWLPLMFAALIVARSGRRQWSPCVIAAVLVLLVVMQTACGGSSNSSRSTTYTVTVTGTSGATRHTTQVTVTVQ